MRSLIALLFALPLFLPVLAFRLPAVALRPAIAPRHGAVDDHFAGWTVSDFEYHALYIFSTPAHQNSWGYVNFSASTPGPEGVGCPARPYNAECIAASSHLPNFFYGAREYPCSMPVNGSSLQFKYDWASGLLELNQTFDCSNCNKTFTAVGMAEFRTGNCTSEFWQNSNWTLGSSEFYSVRKVNCPLVQLSIPGDLVSL